MELEPVRSGLIKSREIPIYIHNIPGPWKTMCSGMYVRVTCLVQAVNEGAASS